MGGLRGYLYTTWQRSEPNDEWQLQALQPGGMAGDWGFRTWLDAALVEGLQKGIQLWWERANSRKWDNVEPRANRELYLQIPWNSANYFILGLRWGCHSARGLKDLSRVDRRTVRWVKRVETGVRHRGRRGVMPSSHVHAFTVIILSIVIRFRLRWPKRRHFPALIVAIPHVRCCAEGRVSLAFSTAFDWNKSATLRGGLPGRTRANLDWAAKLSTSSSCGVITARPRARVLNVIITASLRKGTVKITTHYCCACLACSSAKGWLIGEDPTFSLFKTLHGHLHSPTTMRYRIHV